MSDNQKINIDLSSCDDIACSNCGGCEWQEIYKLKRVSALLSPNGKEMVVPLPMVICVNCSMSIDESEEKRNEVKNDQ